MRIIATTKFVGPTNHRGSRVRVRIGHQKPVFVSWDHALNSEANHIEAVRVAVAKRCAAWSDDVALRADAIAYTLPDANDDAMVVILESVE